MTFDMNIDLSLLLKQKRALLRAMAALESRKGVSRSDVDLLQGVLYILDDIHDALDPP
jgi:hypothetical protein